MTSGRRYLVVDDNQPLAENLGEILSTSGASVDVEVDPLRALERLRTTHYSALITDMRMPGLSGADLLAAARRDDPALPALVITAFINDAELARVVRMGVLGALPKPIPLETMLRRLEHARRGAVVWVRGGSPDWLSNVLELVRERGCTPVIVSDDPGEMPTPRPLLVIVVSAGEAETGRWSQAHPGVPIVSLPGPLESVTRALEAALSTFEDAA